MKNLRLESIHAVKWKSINQFLELLVRFGITVFMARLLTPKDFGLMAMLLVITDLSYIFIAGGFNAEYGQALSGVVGHLPLL